jgi:SAM-dependent methyltransferase
VCLAVSPKMVNPPIDHNCRRWQITLGARQVEILGPPDENALLEDPEVIARFETDEYLPYWGQLWPAAVMLAEYVLADEPGLARPALELGCGLGLPAIAARMAGWCVQATDYDETALQYARENATLNGFPDLPVRLLDWRRPTELGRYHRILGADVLYERRHHQPIADLIMMLLDDHGLALISDPNRKVAKGFEEVLLRIGLGCEKLPTHANQPYGRYVDGTIYKIRRRAVGLPALRSE